MISDVLSVLCSVEDWDSSAVLFSQGLLKGSSGLVREHSFSIISMMSLQLAEISQKASE